MDKYFLFKNCNLMFDNKVMISSFDIQLDCNVCLLGESGTGKSMLLKYIVSHSDLYQTNGKVSFYFGESKNLDNWETFFSFEKLDFDTQEFLKNFLKDATGMKYGLCIKIMENPDFLFCEQLKLSRNDMSILLNFFRKKNIKLFYVTNQIEQTVLFDYLIVLKNNQVAIEGKTALVLKEEKLMKLLGYSLPFYVNLSKQLGYYGLVDAIYCSKEELEEAIWQSK